MYALTEILLTLILMVILLRKKVPVCYAILASALLLFVLSGFVPSHFLEALKSTFISWPTWNMVFTLYLVMCLEYLLRSSGILKDFTNAAGTLFKDNRIVLGFMPAFLGFLPSLGGAIFSAPMVEEAAKPYNLSPERKTAINYWFRHVWEFCNPILPSMLLAASLTAISLTDIIRHQFILSFVAIFIGAVVLLRGKDFHVEQAAKPAKVAEPAEKQSHKKAVILAIGPIVLNVFLVTVCGLNTTLSMGIVVVLLLLILKLRASEIGDMLIKSFHWPITASVVSILFFQGMLYSTGTIDTLIEFFQNSGISASTVVYLTAFFMGLLTGLPQGFAAVAFPLIVPLLHANLDGLTLTYICGLTGVMLSPAHLCIIVTSEYFHAGLFRSLKPVALAQISLLIFTFLWIYLF